LGRWFDLKGLGIPKAIKIETGAISITKFFAASEYGARVYMNPAPTDDCQTFSVGEIRSLFNTPDKSKRLAVIKALHGLANKKQMLFNIQVAYEELIDAFLKENQMIVVFKQPYKSTRGTDMIFYLVSLVKTFNLQ
jgi:hypothetical protein